MEFTLCDRQKRRRIIAEVNQHIDNIIRESVERQEVDVDDTVPARNFRPLINQQGAVHCNLRPENTVTEQVDPPATGNELQVHVEQQVNEQVNLSAENTLPERIDPLDVTGVELHVHDEEELATFSLHEESECELEFPSLEDYRSDSSA